LQVDMKVLLSWLKEYVDIDVTPKELEEKLFSAGLEVEEVTYLGENIEKIYVGQVTSIEKYEGTHLYICHIDCGEQGHDHLILTGADNVFQGAKVPACLVGAKLPNGLEIAPRKMKDMMSYGMLCSGEELCLDKETYHYKQQVALKFADLVYNGQWYTPLRQALSAFVDSTQETVTGDVKLKLYKGNIIDAGVTAPYSLYDEEIATFDEDEVYNQADSAGFINLFGLPIKVQAKKGLTYDK